MKGLLLVLIIAACSVRWSSLEHPKICDSCNCHVKLNERILHVNCTRTPQFEKNIDLKSKEMNEVHVTLEHMNLTSIQHYIAFKLETLNITTLSLNYNNIKSIPSYTFSKFKNLFSLSLVENEIASISQESFGGLSNLKSLNISYNALQSFDVIYLNDLKQLTTLDLQGNQLLKFESTSTLPRMPLTYLDLGENKLIDFPVNALKSFRELVSLNLSKNQITSLPRDAFEMQNFLEDIDFSHNQLAEIDINAFPKENKLKVLDLNHNLISSSEFIAKLQHLSRLDLSFNTITTLNTASWSRDLVELLLSNNGVTCLDDILKGLPQLKKLDASWNQCTKIPDLTHSNLNQLILDANAISNLPPRAAGNGPLTYLSLSDLPRLTILKKDALNGIFISNSTISPCAKLQISRTGLQKIEKGTLSKLHICEVTLNWNELTELPGDTFNWDRIQKIDLQGNPWHCSCSMQWLLAKVVTKMYKNHQDLLNNLRCHTPKSLEGIRLVHWFNKTESALCSEDILKEANVVTISSSTAMIVLDVTCGIIAVALVTTGFYLQRRLIKQRKARRNRRL